jgi:hypothetical protein
MARVEAGGAGETTLQTYRRRKGDEEGDKGK